MIQLNYRDSKPIYEQIKDGLRRLVVSGAVKKDEKLPSVRELATNLSINPNTIQKAYRELEQEGYIYTIAGKGSYAAERADVTSGRNMELMNKFDEIVKELLYLNGDKEMLINRIEELAKGGHDHDRSQ
ncbi:MAG: GntR family transcriptional regulator [Pseudobutyrivibrio sp.]|nr:GntR family transcriptional regulator [Pseudobutyrivibrio sp.]